MRTREQIKVKALELFNQQGVLNVTLRDVAKALNKSYGNLTYHFKNKEVLIGELYEDMVSELESVRYTFKPDRLFQSLLEAPEHTFALSLKYLFFYADFVEIRRKYPDLFEKVHQQNNQRKQGYLQILKQLQVENYLQPDLKDDDLDYLMDLSGSMRTFFFLNLHPDEFKSSSLKARYVEWVNKLVWPYLTDKGKQAYQLF